MRKHIYILIAISAIAGLLSALLWNWHYYPENAIGGGGFYNPYIAVSASKWSTLLGVPLPAIGVFLHVYIIFVLLIADYAGGRYPLISIAIIIPIAGAILCFHLASVLLVANTIKSFNVFSTAFFAANLAVFIICIRVYLAISSKGYRSMPGIIKNIFADPGDNPDRKAAIAYSTLFVFFLAFTVATINHIVKLEHPQITVSEKQVQMFLDIFDSTPTEELNLPESSIRFGDENAEISMIVFTDFLCKSCERFYQTEKYLASRFGKRINFAMYHFPLDASCNKYIDDTLYVNSCLASQAMQTAADMNIFEIFIERFIKANRESSSNLDLSKILEILEKTKLTAEQKKDFEDALNLGKASAIINSHIDAAERLQIDGTPTVFINGKRFSNVPPKEMLEALIERELSK